MELGGDPLSLQPWNSSAPLDYATPSSSCGSFSSAGAELHGLVLQLVLVREIAQLRLLRLDLSLLLCNGGLLLFRLRLQHLILGFCRAHPRADVCHRRC